MMLLIVLIISLISISVSKEIYCCESGHEGYLGKYEKGQEVDGVPSYTNGNEMSFFRNKGFWYLGNLGPWPPETHFRCVDLENCGFEAEFPNIADNAEWSNNKKYSGDISTPKFSTTPCSNVAEEL